MKNIFRITLSLLLVISLAFRMSACSEDGTVTYETVEMNNDIKSGDVTVYHGEISYPKIKIKGRKEVQCKINSSLEAIAMQILEPEYDFTVEYEDITSQGGEYFSGAEHDVSLFISRQTESYLFLRGESYLHEACAASDTQASGGMCFSLTTGEETALSDLTDDFDLLCNTLVTELKRTAKSDGVKDVDFELAEELLSDGSASWYVDDDGLTLTFTAGEISPMVYGNIYVTISDERLGEAGIELNQAK